MDDQSDDSMEYRSSKRRFTKKNDSSDSHLSISDDDEEDAGESLEIKPPQARVYKHSRHRRPEKHSSRKSSSRAYLKGHDIDRMKEEYRRKKAYSHHAHLKPYEAERQPKGEEEYRRSSSSSKKAYSHHNVHSEHHKKRSHQESKVEVYAAKEYNDEYPRSKKAYSHHVHREHRKKRSHQDPEVEVYAKEPEVKRRRHHKSSSDSRRRDRAVSPPEKVKHSRHSKSSMVVVSEDSGSSAGEKETVVDVEISPPVLKDEEATPKAAPEPVDEKEEEEVEEEEEEGEDSSDSSESSGSESDSNSDSSSTSSSSNSTSEDADEDDKNVDKSITRDDEDTKDSSVKEDSSPMVQALNDIDADIQLEKDTLPCYFPAIQGCRSVEEFQCLNRIEEGTYGVVYRAREKRTDKIVALKRLKMEKEKDGFPITSLREINTLLKAQHPNIVTVKEIVVGSNMDKIFIVMDYVEHDLKSLMETMKQKKQGFSPSEVKCLMIQLLRAVNHLHDNWILHRDLKTSNLLFSHTGVLKVGDFGLAREYGSPLKQYTPIVVTLWYRAPELLLGVKEYSTCIDMWSVGCIFAELLCMEPLFPGKSDLDQLNRIFRALGTPNARIWPEYPDLPLVQKGAIFPDFPAHSIKSKFVPSIVSDIGYDLLTSFLTYDTKKRITAETALKHDYFSEHPPPTEPAMFPTWPSKSEPGYRKAIAASSPKPPSGGQRYKDLKDDDGFYIGVGEDNRGFNLKSTFSLKF
ncbi:cyclin-dependent kinase 11B-like [Planococcus citri]|uniref:cyclin-dependent kinase 11B-like n=1 Tax=Planococcus citri TaxID=170843 RepID=UPI0031F80501